VRAPQAAIFSYSIIWITPWSGSGTVERNRRTDFGIIALLNLASAASASLAKKSIDPAVVALFVLLATAAIFLKRYANRVEHVLLAKRLGQELDRSGFHRLHRHRNVAMPGNVQMLWGKRRGHDTLALFNGYGWSAPCQKHLTRAGPSQYSSKIAR
jgi:hypothetical protein